MIKSLMSRDNTPVNNLAVLDKLVKANTATTAFQKQEALKEAIVKDINATITRSLMIAFNDAKNDLHKQAVIEAAQEFGFIDLAIDMISSL